METNADGTREFKPLPWGFWSILVFTSLMVLLFSCTQLAVVKGSQTGFKIFYPQLDLSLAEYTAAYILWSQRVWPHLSASHPHYSSQGFEVQQSDRLGLLLSPPLAGQHYMPIMIFKAWGQYLPAACYSGLQG
jgi:hypothetical protein